MMKFNLLIIFCFGINALFSQDDLFQKANKHYSEGNYEEAIHLYDSLGSEGKKSKELFFNLGNSHFKIQEIGLAILYFEKALKYDPNDRDVVHNLQFCNKLILDKGADLNESPINQLLFQNDKINRYGIIASITFLCIFLVIILHLYRPLDKRILFSAILLFSLTGIIFTFLGHRQIQFLNSEKFAIIISSTTNIKSEPLEGTNTAFVLHEGSKVEVLITETDWTKILFDTDKIGWIKNKHIKTI